MKNTLRNIKVKLLILAFCGMILKSYSQKKHTVYHIDPFTKKIVSEKIKQEKIEITEDCVLPKIRFAPKVFEFLVGKIVAPYAIDFIKNKLYNPKKYINTTSGEYNLISKSKVKSLENIKCLQYSKYDDKIEGLRLNFTLSKIVSKDPKFKNFRVLNFKEIILKKSKSKIKNRAKKVNAIVEVFVNYFNKQGKKESLVLDPFQIKGILPNGEISEEIELKDNYRIIPELYMPKSIQIKVTEVNARKKDMDKWLELYTKHKDDIQSLVIENILKKD